MNHLWLIPFLAVLLILRPSSSFACLNDTSVRAAEDEFRSRYESTAASDASNSPSNQFHAGAINIWGVAALSVGSGLIAGSSVLAFRRRKRQGV